MTLLKKIFRYTFAILLVSVSISLYASTTDGTINATNHSALLCMDETCTTTTQINFLPTHVTTSQAVHITNGEMTGYVWSEEMGWIVLNCSNTTSGCSSTNGNFKVANDGDGNLSGYAWGENSGWVNFGPFTTSTIIPVSIDSNGQFNGYAWAQNYGWIKFDCATANACVETDWRHTDTGGGGGDTTPPVEEETDVCPNISGTQSSVPYGFYTNGSGDCVITHEYYCTLNPTDSSCITPDFCTLHPTDPTCVTPDFCTTNPTDPSCVTSDFCTLHPTDPTCVTPDFCTTNPTDPSCVTSDFCTLYPTDSTCVEGGETEEPVCVGPDCEGGAGDNIDNNDNGGGDNGGNNDVLFDGTGVGDVLNTVQDQVYNVSEKVYDSISKTIKNNVAPAVKEVLNSPAGKTTTEAVATAGVATGLYFGVATAAFSSPLAVSEMFLIPIRLWSLLLGALGIRRRRAPWGTVYDSVTKQPLDPAYVVLQDLNGNEIATSITDLDGRYGFLVPKGQYRILANKTNYEFPSKKLAGRTKDELYQDLYFNEIIDIEEDGEVIMKNIPLDPIKFDWNEFAKKDKKLMRFFSRRQIWINVISDLLFALGFIITVVVTIASPVLYNIIILGVYGLIILLKNTVLKRKAYGHIKEKSSKNPLSFAVVRVFFKGNDQEVIHKIADKGGKYYCLIPNGTYYTKIENKNMDESYSLVHVSEPIEVKKGYIDKKFEIEFTPETYTENDSLVETTPEPSMNNNPEIETTFPSPLVEKSEAEVSPEIKNEPEI
jgi:hypothetical protein